jgi:hypothetical protein
MTLTELADQVGMTLDPVGDRLMINQEEASDAAQAIAFEIELEGLLTSLVVVARADEARACTDGGSPDIAGVVCRCG